MPEPSDLYQKGKQLQTIIYSRVVDLSHPIHPDMPLWPGDPAVFFRDEAALDRDGYGLRSFCMGEHSATHVNAPRSLINKGKAVDAYPAESLVLPAIVMDMTQKCRLNPDYRVTDEDVVEWEKNHGVIDEGSLAIIWTGWQDRWDKGALFINQDRDGSMHFPGFSLDAASLLLDDRKAGGLGTDTHGTDPGLDDSFSINRLAATRERLVLECLTNLHQLPPKGAILVIGLLKLVDGTGSPACITAFVP